MSEALTYSEIEARNEHEEIAVLADKKFRNGLAQARQGIADSAHGAYELRKNKGWTHLDYGSLNEYLAQPEVKMSRSEFYRLADIWDSYVLGGGLRPELLMGASESCLEVPLPAIKRELVDPEEAVNDAIMLGRRDLRDKYRELLGKADEDGQPIGDVVASDSASRDELRRIAYRLRDELRRAVDKGWISDPEITALLAEADEYLS